MNDLIISPCCNPEMELDEILKAYSELGYRKFEVFTSWVKSAFDFTTEPAFYIEKGKQYNFKFESFHLPNIRDNIEESLIDAVTAAKFAKAIGVNIVIFKATSKENYIKAAKLFLDAISDLNLTTVVQNHMGAPISTLNDYQEIIEKINDNRLKALLEVGHFHSAGVSWKEGYDLLGQRIALIHIKDQIGTQSVPYGTGEIDLKGLFNHMKEVGYSGDYVIEMEVNDTENTLKYLKESQDYIKRIGVI